jgi:enoyl-CoA hydratase/carnithine racemase
VSFIQIERSHDIPVLKLDRGVTNPLNLALVLELSGILREVRDDSDARGVVLTSASDKFFSIGFDLPELIELGREDFKVFYRAFNRLSLDLYTFPKPTMAAVRGHAVAGGCILALCCDHRYVAEGHKLMGVNEVKLGVPVPYPGDCVLRSLVSPQNSREILLRGEFYEPDDLLRMGMVDEILPPEDVLPASIGIVRGLGALPAGPFQAIKRNRVEPVVSAIEARLAEKEESFMELWFSREAQNLLREATKKF